MNFSYFLAMKYLRSKNGDSFIRVVRGFSVIGIALGVAALIVVMAVMNGFREELVSKIVGFNGHVYIKKFDGKFDNYQQITQKLSNIPEIVAITPVIEGEALFSFDGGSAGVMIRSIKQEDLFKKTHLVSAIIQGDFVLEQENEIVIGRTLARDFFVRMEDQVNLVVPAGKFSVFGMVPNSKTMEVSGVFDVGMSEYNRSYVFVNFDFARKFLRLEKNAISFLEIDLNNAEVSDIVARQIYDLIGDEYVVSDWQMRNFSIINALKTERMAMFTILALIVIVAAFNIISSLTMMVKDKTSDIAIFRTIGASKTQTVTVFIIIGVLMGVIGTILGMILGISFATNIDAIKNFLESFSGVHLFDPMIYYLSFMPSKISYVDVFRICALSMVLCLLSTIYPAFRAAKLEPVESLRFK